MGNDPLLEIERLDKRIAELEALRDEQNQEIEMLIKDRNLFENQRDQAEAINKELVKALEYTGRILSMYRHFPQLRAALDRVDGVLTKASEDLGS